MIPKIAFLFDESNDWLNHDSNFISAEFQRDNLKIEINKFYDANKIEKFDIVFILGYTKILPSSFLKRNALNLVVHASDLPSGKGFAPIQHQILEGKEKKKITLLETVESVDSGPILLQNTLNFDGTELYDEIRSKQAQATILLIDKFIKLYPNFERKKQSSLPQVKEHFYPKRLPKDGELNIEKSIKDNFNLLRLGNNKAWPSFFIYKKKKYIIKIFED